ncbi:DUF3365 domain-containing protein [Flavobacteriales bacterium]|nr:DUF3365 domain-containing protein [Flavobacteriales bacterium]
MKNYTFIFLLSIVFIVSLFLQNCSDNIETDNKMLAGQQSIITNCSACHNLPNKNRTGIAPPFSHIKDAYQDSSEEDFTNSMVLFLNSPTKDLAKMKNAVEKHGLMPSMSYSEKELKKITHYLYHTDLENFKEISGDIIVTEDSLDYLELGRSLALKTKSILGKNLMMNVKEKGADGAVEFCNEKAIVITDSMSISLNAIIKRVSDKPRNHDNFANESELEYIASVKNGINVKGLTKEINKKIVGYYPIKTNDLCMKCHGDNKSEINKKTSLKINELYPNDKATGYTPDQIRGIWVVEMDKK